MSAGVSLAELLRRRTSVPAGSRPPSARRRPVYSLPASVFDPPAVAGHDPEVANEEPQEPADFESDVPERVAYECAAPTPSVAQPLALGIEVPVPDAALKPPGLLTAEQVYAFWLSRLLTGEAEVIQTWPRIYLAARSIGLTRLGDGHYTPAAFRRACERLVREGRAIPFWYVARGRPPVAITTYAHLWAFALAGFHRRLGRRASTLRVLGGVQDRAAAPTDAAARAEGSATEIDS